MLTEKQRERFFDKVAKTDKCWLWQAGLVSGYGKFKLNSQDLLAHRVSYKQHKGSIPDGMFVLHKCDVRACVNPKHLFLGTPQDNMDDMKAKGRGHTCDQRGAANKNAKLTQKDVHEIVRRLPVNNNKQIAAEYNVTHHTISLIRRGKNWARVTGINPSTHAKHGSTRKAPK